MSEMQELLVRGLAMFGCSSQKTQEILMLVWEDEQTVAMLQYMLEHLDATPAMLYETALKISKSTPTHQ